MDNRQGRISQCINTHTHHREREREGEREEHTHTVYICRGQVLIQQILYPYILLNLIYNEHGYMILKQTQYWCI